jgi:hypothetical protein
MPKWTEELIIEELIKIQETGAFTDGFTQKLLKNMKRTDLAHAIDRSGQGLAFFQQKLGYLPKERPKGYWNCLDNVLKEIKPFVAAILSVLKDNMEKVSEAKKTLQKVKN